MQRAFDVLLSLVLIVLLLVIVGGAGLAMTIGPSLPGSMGQTFGDVHDMIVDVLKGPSELFYGLTHPGPTPTPSSGAFLPVRVPPPPALTREVVLGQLSRTPELVGARREVTATIPIKSELRSTALEQLRSRFGMIPSPTLGTNEMSLQATVEVAAGIRLEGIENRIELNEDGSRVVVHLPSSQVLSRGIDAEKSGVNWFEQTGVARLFQIDTALFGDAQKDAQRSGVQKALSAGLLDDSDASIRQAITSLLKAAANGKVEVEVIFDPRPTPAPND